jgi:hypothetical protein
VQNIEKKTKPFFWAGNILAVKKQLFVSSADAGRPNKKHLFLVPGDDGKTWLSLACEIGHAGKIAGRSTPPDMW